MQVQNYFFQKIKEVHLRFESYKHICMKGQGVTLDILICTTSDRLSGITSMILPVRPGVSYKVSIQHTCPVSLINIPAPLTYRQDITLGYIEGQGLSRNRNNALSMATADICLIADDDNRYLPEYIDTILDLWNTHPDYHILTFQAETLEGEPLHPYPAPYVCSVEITFSRKAILDKGLRFDERFGLGSPLLCAGEEDIFMADARKAGLTIGYIPKVIVRTDAKTTSSVFIGNRKLQLTKGAVFRNIYGTAGAIWRSFKEAGWYLFHKGANPFPILFNMLKGIWILR